MRQEKTVDSNTIMISNLKKPFGLIVATVIIVVFIIIFITILILNSNNSIVSDNITSEDNVQDIDQVVKTTSIDISLVTSTPATITNTPVIIFTEVVKKNTPTPANKFKYTYITTGTSYEPNPDEYAGFIICEDGQPPCFVYGIKYEFLSKYFVGMKYQISFNEFGNCGAASGTSYCIVKGDFNDIDVVDLQTME